MLQTEVIDILCEKNNLKIKTRSLYFHTLTLFSMCLPYFPHLMDFLNDVTEVDCSFLLSSLYTLSK